MIEINAFILLLPVSLLLNPVFSSNKAKKKSERPLFNRHFQGENFASAQKRFLYYWQIDRYRLWIYNNRRLFCRLFRSYNRIVHQ